MSLSNLFHLHKPRNHKQASSMVSQRVFDLTQGKETVSSVFASDPNAKSPGEVAGRLHKTEGPGLVGTVKDIVMGCLSNKDPTNDHSQEDLDRAAQCGQFGPKRPSDLFLKVPIHR